MAQIGATLLLLHLFSLRNFAVGNTFAKTETVQAAVLGLVLLGDRVAFWPFVGICVSLSGVVLLSATRGLAGGLWNRGAGLGLAVRRRLRAVGGVVPRGGAGARRAGRVRCRARR